MPTMADPTYKKGTPEHTTNHVRKEHPSRRQEMPKGPSRDSKPKKRVHKKEDMKRVNCRH